MVLLLMLGVCRIQSHGATGFIKSQIKLLSNQNRWRQGLTSFTLARQHVGMLDFVEEDMPVQSTGLGGLSVQTLRRLLNLDDDSYMGASHHPNGTLADLVGKPPYITIFTGFGVNFIGIGFEFKQLIELTPELTNLI
jgi:hypothetical protein